MAFLHHTHTHTQRTQNSTSANRTRPAKCTFTGPNTVSPYDWSTVSPCVLHGLSLVQTGLDDRGQPAESVRSAKGLFSLGPRPLQTPHPLQGQQSIQTHAEVMAETPLQNHLQGFTPLACLKKGEREKDSDVEKDSDRDREKEREGSKNNISFFDHHIYFVIQLPWRSIIKYVCKYVVQRGSLSHLVLQSGQQDVQVHQHRQKGTDTSLSLLLVLNR